MHYKFIISKASLLAQFTYEILAVVGSSPHEEGFKGEATGSGLRNPPPGLATSLQEVQWLRHPVMLVGLTG